MNEASWNECIVSNSSIKISSDKFRAKSLIGTANQRIRFIKKHPIADEDLKFAFEDYYSSMIEIVHAILSVNGYKVLNHVCQGFYLRDILNKPELYHMFDNLRIKRNNIVYYGKESNTEIVIEDIEHIKKLIKELEKIYSVMLDRK